MLVVFIIYCKRMFLSFDSSRSHENLVEKAYSSSDDKASQISMVNNLDRCWLDKGRGRSRVAALSYLEKKF